MRVKVISCAICVGSRGHVSRWPNSNGDVYVSGNVTPATSKGSMVRHEQDVLMTITCCYADCNLL